jgi:hypothetical protein
VLPQILASLLLFASPDFPAVFCAVVVQAVPNFLTAVDIPGVLAVASASAGPYVDIPSATGVSKSFPAATVIPVVAVIPAVSGVPAIAYVPAVAGDPALSVVIKNKTLYTTILVDYRGRTDNTSLLSDHETINYWIIYLGKLSDYRL